MEETTKREEVLEKIEELAEQYPGDLLVEDVTSEKDGNKLAKGAVVVGVVAIAGAVTYGVKKLKKWRTDKKEAEAEKIREEYYKQLDEQGLIRGPIILSDEDYEEESEE